MSEPRDDGHLARAELIEKLSQRLWRAEERLTEATSALRAAELELGQMRHSTSWRVTGPVRAFAVHFPVESVRRLAKAVWWTLTLQIVRRLRERKHALRHEPTAARGQDYTRWIEQYDTLDASDLDGMRTLCEGLSSQPLVSVLMPVFDPPPRVLREAIESVLAQVYENWELCIADDASTAPEVMRTLEGFAANDPRVRLVRRLENGGISAASNSALEIAEGALLALLDHDDLLRPHSLLLVVAEFVRDPLVGYVYSDSDRIDERGRRLGHFFKPKWNPTLLLSQNYLCHLAVIRADLVREVGGFRSEYDGSQDWDLALRVTERLSQTEIVHVPHVLYHWRAIEGSVAADGIEAKPYAVEAARRATEDHLRRLGRTGYIVPVRTNQSVRFVVESPQPAVSIVVPSTGKRELLEPCLRDLLSRTEYDNFEVVVVLDQAAPTVDGVDWLADWLTSHSHVRAIAGPPPPFNFAATVNHAAAKTGAPFLLLMNDDTTVLYDDWCELMVGHALADRVGAVGGLMVYPDATIYSAGMLLGARGVADHRYHRRPSEIYGYANRAKIPQDLSVLAATCLLLRREAFDEVGGLDEMFPVAYNDVDLCLKLQRSGWRLVYAPDAVIVHHGSASFGTHQLGREDDHHLDDLRMLERWGEALNDDPNHNPNLALDASHPDRLAFPPRTSYPWRDSVVAGVRRDVK